MIYNVPNRIGEKRIMRNNGMNIKNKSHPEWGEFAVMRLYDNSIDNNYIWEIRGQSGNRILSEQEFKDFWTESN